MRNALFLCITIIILIFCASYNYLLFHVFVELISVVIAFSLFTITWNLRDKLRNNYLLMVGICAGFIAFLDLMHTLTFEGMDIIKDSNGLYAPQFWIATRWMEAVTLLVGFLFVNLKKKINSVFIFSCYFVATLLIFLSIVKWHIFPACFIPGKGLTPFKIYSEYAIIMVCAYTCCKRTLE